MFDTNLAACIRSFDGRFVVVVIVILDIFFWGEGRMLWCSISNSCLNNHCHFFIIFVILFCFVSWFFCVICSFVHSFFVHWLLFWQLSNSLCFVRIPTLFFLSFHLSQSIVSVFECSRVKYGILFIVHLV